MRIYQIFLNHGGERLDFDCALSASRSEHRRESMGELTVMCLRSDVLRGLPTHHPDPPNHAHLLPGSRPIVGAAGQGGALPSQLGWLARPAFAHQLTHGSSKNQKTNHDGWTDHDQGHEKMQKEFV